LIAGQRPRVIVRATEATGHAAEAIAAVADAGEPDLIVMGTHGHSALGNVLLGSVATGVLARCRAPVLLVHWRAASRPVFDFHGTAGLPGLNRRH